VLYGSTFDLQALDAAAWQEFLHPSQPAAVRRPYSLRAALEADAFDALVRLKSGMQQVCLELSGAVPGSVPARVTFTPRGSGLDYGVDVDLHAGDNWLRPGLDLPIDTLRPEGTWNLRVRNEADPARYPAFFAASTGGGRATWSHVGKLSPTNVALGRTGATATASSTYDRDTPAEAVINGDHLGATWPTGWADNTYAAFPDWVEVDFAGPRALVEIDLYTTQDDVIRGLPAVEPTPTTTFQVWGLMDFDIQYSTGSAWQTVPGGHVVNNNLVWRKFTLAPPLTTDRIRVMCYRGGLGYSRIVEVQAFDQTGTNVGLQTNGGHASASSVLQMWPPQEAIDGDRIVYHWVGQQPFVFPGWLRVDFPSSQTIDEIDLYFHQDYSHGPFTDPGATLTSIYALSDFDLQYWTGTAWVTLPGGQVRGNNLVWRRFTFPPVTTSAIRVWVVASASGGVAIQEVEAYTVSVTDQVWFDGALPPGAVPGGNEPWTWVTNNPTPYAGSAAHQSSLAGGARFHSFTGANPLLVNRGDKLYAYVWLDSVNPPSEIMLQWFAGTWEHRAYWGANNIVQGSDGTVSRHRVGDLPAAGGWARLEVPADVVGLEGRSVTGMSFGVYGERNVDLSWLTGLTLDVEHHISDILG
jgi:hypothetical protein